MPYSQVSIVGYNSNPPEDDGTQASSNEVSWSKHKTKLGDPIKTALETTQTNITTVVNSIEADLIEAGTAMLFMQTAAPTGWTKDTTANLNDTALRLVTGTVSSRVDQSAFATVFAKTATDGHSLIEAELAAHTHGSGSYSVANHSHSLGFDETGSVAVGSGGSTTRQFDNTSSNTGTEAPDVNGSSGSTGSGTAHAHDMDIRVNYHDCIRATKD